ncbi:MAG: nuclease-related domain-containing protein [Oscillospiraceae bacterium]
MNFADNGIFIAILFAAVAATLGIGFLIYTLYKKAKSSTKDVKNKAQKPLSVAKGFAKLHEYTLISPCNLAKDGKFADVDFAVVGYFGVLGVKCIGLGGEIYGSSGDAMWLQVTNTQRISFENPLIRAQADARLIRDTLFAAGLKSVPVEVICVCTNPKASLALPRSTGHFTMKDYKAYLKKDKFEQDKKVDLEATVAAISKWRTETSV